MAQQRLLASQNLPLQVVGSPASQNLPPQVVGPQNISLNIQYPLTPSLPLTPPCSPLSPESPWAPGTLLGPQKALEALGSHRQPWVFSQTQGPCFPCSPSPLALSCSPLPPSLPKPPWAPGTFLGPQEALGAFRSLRQPWVFS